MLIWSYCLMVTKESEQLTKQVVRLSLATGMTVCNFPSIQYVDTHVCFIQQGSKQCKCVKLDSVVLDFSLDMATDLWMSWIFTPDKVKAAPESFNQKPVGLFLSHSVSTLFPFVKNQLYRIQTTPFIPQYVCNITIFWSALYLVFLYLIATGTVRLTQWRIAISKKQVPISLAVMSEKRDRNMQSMDN